MPLFKGFALTFILHNCRKRVQHQIQWTFKLIDRNCKLHKNHL